MILACHSIPSIMRMNERHTHTRKKMCNKPNKTVKLCPALMSAVCLCSLQEKKDGTKVYWPYHAHKNIVIKEPKIYGILFSCFFLLFFVHCIKRIISSNLPVVCFIMPDDDNNELLLLFDDEILFYFYWMQIMWLHQRIIIIIILFIY